MTTILSVRCRGKVAVGGDGQVSLGNTVVKHQATKIRSLADGKVLVGFAGGTADAFALLERFEGMLKKFQGNCQRAAIELAKEWRSDRVLRRLESLLAVADRRTSLLVSGVGDVLEPDDGVLGIGSGGNYAVAAARALMKHSTLSAREIVNESLLIASRICVFTNDRFQVEELDSDT
ncbi:MAG: ATP-dependent protease subunit HslV [Planctomycetes bacterium]|nr:ATP-dependent protease subunit HslV [Planctomycetota bacterium]